MTRADCLRAIAADLEAALRSARVGRGLRLMADALDQIPLALLEAELLAFAESTLQAAWFVAECATPVPGAVAAWRAAAKVLLTAYRDARCMRACRGLNEA